MSYEFTRLPEVEVLENLTENAHLIVEDGGKTRRFPASEFSGGDTVLGEDGKLVESVLPDGYPYDFGTEIVEEFLVEETTHNFDDTWWQPEDFVFELKPNATHIVTWDGTEYECTVMKAEGTIYTVLGNGAFASDGYYEDTGEPFCFLNAYGDSHIAVSESALGSHTFSVKTRTVKKNCRKIGADFLPDGYPYSEIKNVMLIPESTIIVRSDTEPVNIIYTPVVPLVKGNHYTVVWDNVEYNCVATMVGGIVSVGNAAAFGPLENDTGEPFFIAIDEDMIGGAFILASSAGTHTVSVSGNAEIITKIDKKYLPKSVGVKTSESGEIFNDYQGNSADGEFSHAEGSSTQANGQYSHAEGYNTIANNDSSHAEGYNTRAIAGFSHTEGYNTEATGSRAHAEGTNTLAAGFSSHAEGYGSQAVGQESHAEGDGTIANGSCSHAEGAATTTTENAKCSHAEGFYTNACSQYQHVQGKFNIEDSAEVYAHIVGNGTNNTARSNAHTLDWSGNGWFAGTVEGTALILKSPNGTRYQITVSDTGELSASALA